jgi:hypothetical protein
MKTEIRRAAILAAVVSSLLSSPLGAADAAKAVLVDCSNGKTLASALEKGALLLVVRGVCGEHVTIDRNDVTLRGEPGAAILGPDGSLDVVTVTASRVAIENLVVSGGKNGVVANGATGLAIRGSTVQSTGRTGVILLASSSAVIDGSTVQSNPRDGVSVDGAQATLINSTVRQNARIGVFVGTGGAARIGVDNANNAGGNTITQNGSSGIALSTSAGAIIGNNAITFNGADLAATTGRNGIAIVAATADIVGSNTISDNTGQGIFMRGASVQIGNPSFPFPTVNTISNNGDAASAGGVFAFLGSTVVVRDAVITGNRGFGLGFTARSQGQVFNSQFNNNVAAGFNLGDGVRVALGSAVLFNAPPSVASGNAGAGVFCTDLESSVQILANTLDVSMGNATGGVVNCTGF